VLLRFRLAVDPTHWSRSRVPMASQVFWLTP